MADLLDIADRIAGWAADGEQLEAYVARGKDTDVVVYEGQIESLSSAEAQGVGIRVIVGGREGFAYAASFDDAVLRETLAEARDNASFAEPDEFNGLAVPDGVPEPVLDIWRDSLATVPTDQKVELAMELERMIVGADPRIRKVEESNFGDGMVERAVVTTTGIRAEMRSTGCSVAAYALSSDGDETQTGFGFSVGRELADLDLDKAARDTVERATRMLGAVKPESDRLVVVLDPYVASQFLGILSVTLNGEAVLKGRSLFAERVGEEVASPIFTLVDDPTNALAYSASPQDAEGLASRRNALIEGGVLRGFVHNTYTGRRSGGASTGSAVRGGFKSLVGVGCRALALEPGTQSQAELIAGVDNGVLVQSVKGMHSGVNPISGDFSTGIEGLRIRGGALAEPVRECTIGSTIQRMLQGLVAIGNDVEWLPSNAAGVTIVIGDVTLSGR